MEKRQIHFNIGYLILALIGVLWLREIWVTARQVQPIPYSEFQQQLKDGRIKEIAISRDTIQGTYQQPLADGRDRFVFRFQQGAPPLQDLLPGQVARPSLLVGAKGLRQVSDHVLEQFLPMVRGDAYVVGLDSDPVQRLHPQHVTVAVVVGEDPRVGDS